MSVLPVGFGASGGGGYQIERSLRFRDSAPAYLSWAPSASNQKTWTWSGWVKRGSMGASLNQSLFEAGFSSTPWFFFGFVGDNLYFSTTTGVSGLGALTSNAVFRDPSAWYHIVARVDTTQVTAADRVRVYVNGVSQTFQAANYPAQNADLQVNSAVVHQIGGCSGLYLHGYLAEINFASGQSLDPSSFGQYDPVHGQWTAKKYTGTYGTNGFYLDFADPTNLTTLMADRSGNGNNWTANNISLAAGSTYDSMLDVPLGAGGNERGNYGTLNPLDTQNTHSEANLAITQAAQVFRGTRTTVAVPTTGKYYWEYPVGTTSGGNNITSFGVSTPSASLTASPSGLVGFWGLYGGGSGNTPMQRNGSSSALPSAISITAGDIFQVAFDADNNRAWLGRNGLWWDASNGTTGAPSSGSNPTFTSLPVDLFGYLNCYQTTARANFGQLPFSYTPPTGFKALHTDNLTNTTPIASSSFTGNLSTDGPFIWCNGTPETLTINGNAVTWGTHADKLATGFKVRSSSSSYNSSGTNTWTATYLSPSSKSAFKYQNAKGNP